MKQFEQKQERILTREEVLSLISKHAEQFTVTDERRDEAGVYYLETQTPEVADKPGHYTSYIYQRKGKFERNAVSRTTTLEAIYYADGRHVEGDIISELDPDTNEWVEQ